MGMVGADTGCPARLARQRSVQPSAPPKRDCTRHRSRTRPNGVAVVTALHDPLTVLVANDFAHVVPPDDDGADGRTACARPVVSPGSREIVGGAGVTADLRPHIPAAPCGGPTRIVLTSASMMVVVVIRPGLCTRSHQTKHCRCSHENTLHGCSLTRGGDRAMRSRKAAGRRAQKARQATGGMSEFAIRSLRLRNRLWPKWGNWRRGTRNNGQLDTVPCIARGDDISGRRRPLQRGLNPLSGRVNPERHKRAAAADALLSTPDFRMPETMR